MTYSSSINPLIPLLPWIPLHSRPVDDHPSHLVDHVSVLSLLQSQKDYSLNSQKFPTRFNAAHDVFSHRLLQPAYIHVWIEWESLPPNYWCYGIVIFFLYAMVTKKEWRDVGGRGLRCCWCLRRNKWYGRWLMCTTVVLRLTERCLGCS